MIDWELPDISGKDIVIWIRANLDNQLPVIFLTNRNQDHDLVHGLNAGADDYLAKPFKAPELIARIRALLRRNNAGNTLSILKLEPYLLNPQKREITLHGEPVQLAPKEFDLAYLFFSNIGRFFFPRCHQCRHLEPGNTGHLTHPRYTSVKHSPETAHQSGKWCSHRFILCSGLPDGIIQSPYRRYTSNHGLNDKTPPSV